MADYLDVTLSVNHARTGGVRRYPVLLTRTVLVLIGEIIEVWLDARRLKSRFP
jgi:hypothetical protein